jgi:short subunit dehydrogenase-like uncharacterized protein
MIRPSSVMVYGANGYTGRLVVAALRERGIPFFVAGRNEEAVRRVAETFDVSGRVFALDDEEHLVRALAGVDVLLNAAGPFRVTTAPLVRACLRNRTHYLDVSSEVAPLELVSRLGDAARAQGIMLLPAVGFDVVPSDCLAVHLSRRCPNADELTLTILGPDLLSRGSAVTFAGHTGVPNLVRRDGVLEPLRFRSQMRWVDHGGATRLTLASSWGDLVTAFRSTRIPNIEVYFEATPARILTFGSNEYFRSLLRPVARAWFDSMARLLPEGPSPDVRARHSAIILGEVRRGRTFARSVLNTKEAYSFTGLAAAAVVECVLAGAVSPGFHTPGTLLGPDFPLSIGATRADVS